MYHKYIAQLASYIKLKVVLILPACLAFQFIDLTSSSHKKCSSKLSTSRILVNCIAIWTFLAKNNKINFRLWGRKLAVIGLDVFDVL